MPKCDFNKVTLAKENDRGLGSKFFLRLVGLSFIFKNL